MTNTLNKVKSRIGHQIVVNMVSFLVGLYGFYDIISTLLDQFMVRRLRFLTSFVIDIHLLLGLGFIYLSILLARRKRNALIVALLAFAFLLGEGSSELFAHGAIHQVSWLILTRVFILPLAVMIALVITRNEFQVKSDISAFASSLKLAVLALIVTLAYGTVGFMLMDNSDFHQEIGFTSALHHTVDQFDLTTNKPLHPYTKRARLFMDSLSFISVISIAYVALSLFIPVRARLIDQASGRQRMKRLMEEYGAPSEDFFKIWPPDKHYFFSQNGDAGLAYSVRRGVALVLADPVGNRATFSKLFRDFHDMCWSNDWAPTLIHIEDRYSNFYKDIGYQLQLIGQEAVVDISNFVEQTSRNKYFRNIKNRFNRQNFSVEILEPPHHQAVIDRLKIISDQWLNKPGRVERGFVMGYFNEDYVQQCRIVVVRDAAKTIQSFMNLIPSHSFNEAEATYDMLRSAPDAPPNINDFLLYCLLFQLSSEGYKQFNLGLSPLVGLDEETADNNLIGRVLRFGYVNGDRLYSFSGLHRFKDKYDPQWSDRYLAYRGGVRGFTKMLNALYAAMKVSKLKR